MNGPFDLSDRVAVVTGGGRGIGREISRVLASAGANIAIAEIDPAAAEEAAEEIAALGRQSLAVPVDVTDLTAVEAMVAQVIEGLGPIDILVNNAAVGAPNEPFLIQDPDLWRRSMAVDLDGVAWCSRAVGARMVERRSGAMVNIASMSGLIVNRPQPQADYNAAKAAVIHLTRSLACEWAESGVRVNAVSPGYVATDMTKKGMATSGFGQTWMDMTPMKRIGTPTEVANAVWFLASDAASYCTGTNLIVDGGYTCW